MTQRVFISRSPEQIEDIVSSLEASGIACLAQSLIETRSVRFDMPAFSPDWIFFFSSNAVIHFFGQEPKLDQSIKYGALGESTAESLRRYKEVSYCGVGNNTEIISKDFANHIGKSTVLLPQSRISLRPLQAFLQEDQYVDLVCYTTEMKPMEIPEMDLLVFSSPSNVKSFFLTNTLSNKTGVISFGRATSRALREFGAEPSLELDNLGSENIVRAIKSLLCSSELD